MRIAVSSVCRRPASPVPNERLAGSLSFVQTRSPLLPCERLYQKERERKSSHQLPPTMPTRRLSVGSWQLAVGEIALPSALKALLLSLDGSCFLGPFLMNELLPEGNRSKFQQLREAHRALTSQTRSYSHSKGNKDRLAGLPSCSQSMVDCGT